MLTAILLSMLALAAAKAFTLYCALLGVLYHNSVHHGDELTPDLIRQLQKAAAQRLARDAAKKISRR